MTVPALAQTSARSSVDDLPNGVRLHLANGETVQVEVCSDRIIHVIAQPPGASPLLPSFVVIQKWAPAPFHVDKAHPDAIALSTAKINVRIDYASGAISFLDLQGQPILSEQSRKFSPVTVNKEKAYEVEQTFGCAPDESLYGLGQLQDGYWNWRGNHGVGMQPAEKADAQIAYEGKSVSLKAPQ